MKKSIIHQNKSRYSQSLLHYSVNNVVLNKEYNVINYYNNSLFYTYVNSICSSHNKISPLIKYNNTYTSLYYEKARLHEKCTSFIIIDNSVIPKHTLKILNN